MLLKSQTLQIALILLLSVASHAVYAGDITDTTEPASKPDNDFTANLGGTSDYRYRGISQTTMNPAIQGGADYVNNPTGLYVGTWLSSIKWIKDNGGNGSVEWDLYTGKRGAFTNDLSYDVGILRYEYPSNNLAQIPTYANADTTELYAQLSYKIANIKYSQSTTNIFAFPNSQNSGYIDLWTSIDLVEGYALGVHFGHQQIKNSSDWSYSDWKVGLAKDFLGISWTLGVVGTNANKNLYITSEGKFTGQTSLILSASKSF
jgi:uncharacterized protein (TIGR02001 family)